MSNRGNNQLRKSKLGLHYLFSHQWHINPLGMILGWFAELPVFSLVSTQTQTLKSFGVIASKNEISCYFGLVFCIPGSRPWNRGLTIWSFWVIEKGLAYVTVYSEMKQSHPKECGAVVCSCADSAEFWLMSFKSFVCPLWLYFQNKVSGFLASLCWTFFKMREMYLVSSMRKITPADQPKIPLKYYTIILKSKNRLPSTKK